ncbi:class IV adenylate cyclase [Hespellia stercorisuis]|uniref:Adenylate cyclase, class 2 n=1 Tax=Hespellia stercorisuis DSM 15480 TaxID=1121950 RepID=A0A1M6MTR3_9FIRM|nr:class IV adenylate cyclase [Hespellia stercorisuis]SHJ86796.1 adenylate cyclase, class 2 [Hespellia stercorisuis DSM 15480]
MTEVEIKLPICGRADIEQKLQRIGFLAGRRVEESDVYFNSTLRDFRKTDEALRIRSCDKGRRAFLTYKGPKVDAVSMTRKELETEVGDGTVCQAILESLGYRPVSPVRKIRQYYQRDGMTACVDEVENLGTFLELEIVVPSEKERETALRQIEKILAELGYSMADTTRVSYLSMLEKNMQMK